MTRSRIITLILAGALLWSSCGQRSLLRRADRLDKKAAELRARAVEKGAKLSIDTTWAPVVFQAPAINFEFRPLLPLAKIQRDTVLTYSRTVKGASRPGEVRIWVQRDTVTKIELYCPEQEVKKRVPVKVDNKYTARPKYNFWDGLTLGIILGAAALFAAIYIRQRRQRGA